MVSGEKMALDLMKRPILHPILFALFPVVFLYAHNVDEVRLGDILAPAGVILMLSAGVYLFLKGFLKNEKKAAVMVSFILIVIFSYEHLFPYFPGFKLTRLLGFRLVYLWWWVVLAGGVSFIYKTRMGLGNLTKLLNVVSLTLVSLSLVNIGVNKFQVSLQERGVYEGLEFGNLDINDEEKPDIYYIVLDRYVSEETLREVYDYDNSEFIRYLEGESFFVASESYSNYLITPQSLASSLNAEYINYLSENVGEDSGDRTLLHQKLEDHMVWRFLKAQGYKFIHIGGEVQPTSKNRYADMNFNLSPVSEFSLMLYRSTLFNPITGSLGILDARELKWELVQYQFDKLEDVSQIEGPKFVFAHILAPHDPYVFGEDGEFLRKEVVVGRSRNENYVNQMKFVNGRVRGLLDSLLSDEEGLPIFILQSDEGTYPMRFGVEGSETNWKKATKEELREKMGILNAYYLPGVDVEYLYPTISPVNSFRIVFNLYFGEDFELLPDEHYIFEDLDHLYKFTNVTDKLR